MIPDSHTCPVPVTGRKRRFTCPRCGQFWRKIDGLWKLAEREMADS